MPQAKPQWKKFFSPPAASPVPAGKEAFDRAFTAKCAAAGITDPAQVAAAAERLALVAESLVKQAGITDVAAAGGSAAGNLAGAGVAAAGIGSLLIPAIVGGGAGALAAGMKNQTDTADADTLKRYAEANAYRRRAAEATAYAQVRKLVAADPSKYVVV